MRLWSLHPKYLDVKGLTGLWREALLAQRVLMGETRGYTRHPQLIRFRQATDPLALIGVYLQHVYSEAEARGYHFDQSKIFCRHSEITLTVSHGQIEFERLHLLKKLSLRAPDKTISLETDYDIAVMPIFQVVEGDIEHWEIV